MEQDKENSFEQMFQKNLKDMKMESASQGDWLNLDMKLTKSNFFKFGLYHLNVYYLLVFLTTAMFAATTTFVNHNLTKKMNGLESKVELLEQSLALIHKSPDTALNKPSIHIKANTDIKKQKNNSITNNNSKGFVSKKKSKKDILVHHQTKYATVDSSIRLNICDSIKSVDTTKKKIIKKVIKVKQPDVVITDTVVKFKKAGE